jgi:hypothetical protein
VAHLTTHTIADAVSLLVRVVAILRHRGTWTMNPHAGADDGEEVEECGTSSHPRQQGLPPPGPLLRAGRGLTEVGWARGGGREPSSSDAVGTSAAAKTSRP